MAVTPKKRSLKNKCQIGVPLSAARLAKSTKAMAKVMANQMANYREHVKFAKPATLKIRLPGHIKRAIEKVAQERNQTPGEVIAGLVRSSNLE